MQIFFGRHPHWAINLDTQFAECMKAADFNISNAVVMLQNQLINSNSVYYSFNPLIFNFMDDDWVDKLYFLSEQNTCIKLGTDKSFLCKLKWMGLGEALCDDSRSFNTN